MGTRWSCSVPSTKLSGRVVEWPPAFHYIATEGL